MYDGSERGKGDVMGQQSIRQEARLAARVLVAIRERDAAVAEADRRAGQALREMTEDEGLSVREAVEWCGDEITTREMTRLRRLVEDNGADGSEVDDKNSMPGAAEGLARGSAREDARDAAAS